MSAAFTDPPLDELSSFLDAMPGWALPVAGVGLAALGLLSVLMWAVLRGMPSDPALEEIADDDVPDWVLDLVEEYERIGFERIGPVLEIGITPPGVLVPMRHRERPCFGTVFHVEHGEHSLTGCDVVSILRHELSGLTTGSDPIGGTGPAWPGALRQMLPGARPAELLARHESAIALLEQEGLPVLPARAADFESLFCLSFRLQRHTFMRAPIRNLVRCVWRAVARTNPHVGPLSEQAVARTQIATLRSGAWPDERARRAFHG